MTRDESRARALHARLGAAYLRALRVGALRGLAVVSALLGLLAAAAGWEYAGRVRARRAVESNRA